MTEARFTRRGGFTLVEALAAGVILSIGAVAIGASVNQSMASLARARDEQTAANLLENLMSRIDLIGPDRLMREGPLEGTFDAPNEKFSWRIDIESLFDGSLFEIDVTLMWKAGSADHSATVSTRLNDPPGLRNESLQWEDF